MVQSVAIHLGSDFPMSNLLGRDQISQTFGVSATLKTPALPIPSALAREKVRERQPLWLRSKQPVHTMWGKAGNIPYTPSIP